MENIAIKNVVAGVDIGSRWWKSKEGPTENITLKDVHCVSVEKYGFHLMTSRKQPTSKVQLINCSVKGVTLSEGSTSQGYAVKLDNLETDENGNPIRQTFSGSNVSIVKCVFRDIAYHGIQISSAWQDIQIKDCLIAECGTKKKYGANIRFGMKPRS